MGIITGDGTLQVPTNMVARHVLINSTELSVLYLSISRPCQGGALWGLSFAVCADHFLSQLIHNDLALQILHEKPTPEAVQLVTAQEAAKAR